MRHLLLFFFIFTSIISFNSSFGQQKYETTILYDEGDNSGKVMFRCSFDHMMGELLIKAVAKVDSYEGCDPGVLNVTVDIYDGSSKVSTKTFSNLISMDISGSPDWSAAFPGLNAEQAKDLYKKGFTIKNAQLSGLSFPGCSSDSDEEDEDNDEEEEESEEEEEDEVKTYKSSCQYLEEARANLRSAQYQGQADLYRKEIARLEPLCQREKDRAAYKSQKVLRGTAGTSRQTGSNKSNNTKSNEQEAARREQQRREENQRKKREYDQRIAEQTQRNVQQASAMAAANMGAFVAIGMVLYQDMGNVNASDTYIGNQFNFGINMGYSISSLPLVFNSEITTYIYNYNTGYNEYITKTRDDDRRATTLNMDFKPFFGYEHDYGGVDLYACLQPGTSLIFDRTNFSHYLGGEVFVGHRNAKFFYSFNRGARRFYAFEWINPEEYGNGGSRYKYKKQVIGARFSWETNGYSYARHHLKIGYIFENFLEAIDHDDGQSRVWYYDLDPTLKLDLNKYYRIKGFHLSWVKEHNFDFYANIYPNHPLTGINKFKDSDSFDDRREGAIFFEVGFVRQIKKFF